MVGEAEVVTVDDEGEENSDDDLQVTLFTRTSFDKIYHQVVEEHLAPALNDSNPLNLPPRLQVSLMQANRCEKDSTFILWTVYK